jgi:stage II sporulation protein D
MPHLAALRTSVVCAIVGAIVGASTAPPASASGRDPQPRATTAWSRSVPWPANGVLAVRGHGYGHGHGMSQYGAYGAARRGLSASRILAFYYPGTALATQSEPSLRVLVAEDTDGRTEVLPAARLAVSTPAHPAPVTVVTSVRGRPVTRWRTVAVSGSTVALQYLTDTWRTATIGGTSTHSSVDVVPGSSGTVRLVLGTVAREYRGRVRAVPSATHSRGPTARTIVVTTVGNYLRSVVPSEMPGSWPAPALQAQAVAARTYARFDAASRSTTSPYDTCDTTSCQVFRGVADYTLTGSRIRGVEYPASTAAVTATTGRVLTYRGRLAFTQFSASNGGWSTAGGQPYLRAFADRYDGVVPSTGHSWTDTIRSSSLDKAFGVGALRSVDLVRDGHGEWGGRVLSVVLHGRTATRTVTGSQFAAAAGLKAVWWAPAT